jgi:autotransporter-associated beta strand protein
LLGALLLFGGLIGIKVARGQFVYEESFSQPTVNGWTFQTAGSNPGARLTANAAPQAGDPETGPQIDAPGNGWLRLANLTANQANVGYLATAIPSSNNTVTVTFDFAAWNAAGVGQADGIGFFLYDAGVPFAAGADGGSLGFAQKTGVPGLAGGYVGVGIDVYGNYSNATEGRTGSYPAGAVNPGFQPNEIAVRGPGTGTTGYYYLGGTGGNNYTVGGTPAIPSLTSSLSFPSLTQRPDQDDADFRRIQIELTDTDQLIVRLEVGYETGFTDLFTLDLSGITRPNQLGFGVSAATGGGQQVYEIRNLSIEATGSTDTWYWTNTTNSLWNTAGNWSPTSVPGAAPNQFVDVVLTDNTVAFPNLTDGMTVSVDGGDKEIRSLFIGGSFDYTIDSSGGSQIIFDANGTGSSYLTVVDSQLGGAAHTINAPIRLDNDLSIYHLVDETFTLNGAINMNGNDMLVYTESLTAMSGALSGAGSTLTKDGTGTLTLSGGSANTYTGATTVTEGTLRIEKAQALGTTAAGTTVQTGATLALGGGINFTSAEALNITGAGVNGVGALHNASGSNTWNGATTMAGDATIGAAAGTSLTLSNTATIAGGGNDLTLNIAGTLTSNGVISGVADFTKTGAGTATLNTANTITGTTTLVNGTVQVGNNTALGAAASNIEMGSAATATTDSTALLISTTGVTLSRNIDVNNFGTSATLGGTGNINGTFSGNVAISRDLTLTSGSTGGNTINFTGVISDTGGTPSVTKTGAGMVTLSGTNTFDGPLVISEGTLRVAGGTAINNSVAVSLANTAGAILDLNGTSETIGSLSGGGATGGNVSLGAGTLTTGGNNASTTYGGAISGSGNVTKAGTGTMTFTGANTFTGDLVLNGGTVAIGANNVFSASTDLIFNTAGATLSTSGFNQTFATLSRTAAGTIDFLGTSGSTLTFGSTSGVGALAIDNWNGSFTGGGGTQLDVTSVAAPLVAGITFTGIGAATTVGTAGNYEIVPNLTGWAIWNGVTNDTWNAGGLPNTNWENSAGIRIVDPDATDARALFSTLDPGLNGSTVTLGEDITVGTLVSANNSAFTINGAAGDILTFNVSAGSALLTTIGGTALTISAEITTADDLLITNNSSASAGLTIGASVNTRDINVDGDDLTFAGAGTTIVNHRIDGNGATTITKNDLGTLRINGSNVMSGTFTLNEGLLQIGNNAALGTGTFVIQGGTIEAFGAARTITNAIDINNLAANGFTVTGANTFTFSGTQTVAMPATSLTVTANSGSTLVFNTAKDLTGAGQFVKEGAGTVEFRGNDNDYTGGLTVNAGTVRAGSSGTRINDNLNIGSDVAGDNYLGAGGITVNSGGTVQAFMTGGNAITFANGGAVTVNTGGTLDFSNNSAGSDLAFNGAFNVNGGTATVTVGDDVTMATTASVTVSNSGTMTIVGVNNFSTSAGASSPITVNSGGVLNVNMSSGGSGAITFQDGNTITVDGSGSRLDITNNAGGTVDLESSFMLSNGGQMRVLAGDTYIDSTATLNGGSGATKGTLEVREDLFIAAPSIANTPNITINNAAATVIQAQAGIQSIENLGVVTKTGVGTTTISANVNNIQATNILINQGTLLLGASNQIANNTRMELAGGTFATGGNDEVLATLTLSATSTIDLGAGASILRYATSAGETWNGSSFLVVQNWSGSTNGGGTDQIYFGTTASGLTVSQIGLIQFVNPAGFSPGTYGARILSTGEIVPVPEPAVVAAAFALAAAIAWRECRRRWTKPALDR